MPIAIIVLALTLPRNGTQLDPTGNWYLALFFRTWLICAAIMCVFFFTAIASPQTADRLIRILNGDTRIYRTRIRIFTTEKVFEKIQTTPTQMFYEDGRLIGEVQDTQTWTDVDGKNPRYLISISTDHEDFPPNWRTFAYSVKMEAQGKLVLVAPK